MFSCTRKAHWLPLDNSQFDHPLQSFPRCSDPSLAHLCDVFNHSAVQTKNFGAFLGFLLSRPLEVVSSASCTISCIFLLLSIFTFTALVPGIVTSRWMLAIVFQTVSLLLYIKISYTYRKRQCTVC